MVNSAVLNRFYLLNPYGIAKSSGCNNEISCGREKLEAIGEQNQKVDPAGTTRGGDAAISGARRHPLVVLDNALSRKLLGMSFLSRVRWTQDHGELVLE
jgi:hypothetical protein